MSNAIAITDEVVALINTAVFSEPVTAVRKVLPLYELKDLADLKVTARPVSLDVEPNSRESGQYNWDIEIGIQKHMENIEAEIPGLAALVMEIVKFLRGKPLSVSKALWVKSAVDPLYSVEHLQGGSVFTSIITVTYKTIE